MNKSKIKLLEDHLPWRSIQQITKWIVQSNCEFRVSPSRRTKLGDYRAPYGGRGHRISVNADLNPYAFLLTTVHEFAHLQTWEIYGSRVKPHGSEWKTIFRELMHPLLEAGIFPEQLRHRIQNYMEKPAASSCADLPLYRALRDFDNADRPKMLEDLELGTLFEALGGRSFVKGEKLRKRYRCTEIRTGKKYLFHPLCEIKPGSLVQDGKSEV